MRATLRKQALMLTIANAYTRGVGFLLHVLLARLMDAQALGVMELSHSAIMLAVTPVTAGIPSAVSRLTAQRSRKAAQDVLRAGISLVLRMAAVLAPALVLLSPLCAWLLGDMRAVPAILTSAPEVLLLGLCAVYCGYCYGMENTLSPALNECIEQTVRVLLSVALLLAVPKGSSALTAAIPGLAESVAGVVVLLLFVRAIPVRNIRTASPALRQEISRLASPMTLSRLCQTGMRALNAVLLPVCLRRSGLSAGAATAQFGLLNGMALPLMMLPGIVTSAMCMIVTPAVSRQEQQPVRLRRTMRQMTLCAAGVGLFSSAGLFFAADLIGSRLYHQPALIPLLRLLCPLALVLAVQQVLAGMVTGLGLQRKLLTGTIAGSALTLVLTALLCPLPSWRLYGAGAAMLAGHGFRLAWCMLVLHRNISAKKNNFVPKRG